MTAPTLRQRILACLAEHGPLPAAAVAQRIGHDSKQVWTALHRLSTNGGVEREHVLGRYVYRLPAA